MMKKVILSSLLIFFLSPLFVFAVPINSDVALTPFKGQTIIRSQAKYTRKTNDPTDKDREMRIWMFPATFVYGLTERLAFSLTVPYIDKEQKSTSVGISSTISDSGLGDINLMSKYRIWSKDLPGEARRISLIGGLELPTGDDDAQLKLGSGSVDPVAGILFTNQTLDREFDIDLTYQFNTRASNYEFGDVFKYNVAYQHRVWPWILPEKGVYSQVNLVLEMNLHGLPHRVACWPKARGFLNVPDSAEYAGNSHARFTRRIISRNLVGIIFGAFIPRPEGRGFLRVD